MNEGLSAKLRAQYLQDMERGKLDVLVIGGGITGAGIAWDASCRGMTVGLVEMNDFASGTSGKSAKVIHGGLIYLRQGKLRMVRESCTERALLRRCAPHLVKPLPVLLPIYKHQPSGYLASSIRLYAYDRLAGAKASRRGRMYRREQTLSLENLLNSDALKGAAYCREYRADDARLTIEVLKAARMKGALMVNYAKVLGFIYRGGRIAGVHVEDRLSGIRYPILARQIVNAAGPWADQVRQMDNLLASEQLQLTKGVHLVVDYNKLPVRQAVCFEGPGGRRVLVIPKDSKTCIGMTGTPFEGGVGTPDITDEDKRYLMGAVNGLFPGIRLEHGDIESGWCGLSAMFKPENRQSPDMTGKDGILISESGLITARPGNLTGFRKRAMSVVDLVAKHIQDEDGTIYPPCMTDRTPISGGDLNGLTYKRFKEMMVEQGALQGIGADPMRRLIARYGSNAKKLLDIYRASSAEEKDEYKLLRAELIYSIEHEMTVAAEDFLLRRTGWVWFERETAERMIAPVMEIMGELLDWDEEEQARQWRLLEDQLQMAWGLGGGNLLERFPLEPDQDPAELIVTDEAAKQLTQT